jgi:hypothetical protein
VWENGGFQPLNLLIKESWETAQRREHFGVQMTVQHRMINRRLFSQDHLGPSEDLGPLPTVHKRTLLTMLTPLPTCFILHCGEAEEREAIQFADSDSPEAMAALCDAMEYFELLTDSRATHCPERLVQTVGEPGQQESPCPRCGNSNTYLAILHTGESLRRDCAICGRFVEFPNWHNRDATAKILAAAIAGSRYNEKASCPSAGNTQASSNDLLSLKKETANG